MKLFEYQWREVARCSDNGHIMLALEQFGKDGWEVFQIESFYHKDSALYGVWMRRENLRRSY